MHHLMLTKPFLAVTSLMLFPAFSLAQSMFCAFPRHHGCYGCDSVAQFFSPTPMRNHLLLSNLVTTCFSSTPQLNYTCLSMSGVRFSSLQQHFTVLLIIPLDDCISQAHNHRRSNFCSWSFSASLKFWEPESNERQASCIF